MSNMFGFFGGCAWVFCARFLGSLGMTGIRKYEVERAKYEKESTNSEGHKGGKRRKKGEGTQEGHDFSGFCRGTFSEIVRGLGQTVQWCALGCPGIAPLEAREPINQ
jgi:hypothetical protein